MLPGQHERVTLVDRLHVEDRDGVDVLEDVAGRLVRTVHDPAEDAVRALAQRCSSGTQRRAVSPVYSDSGRRMRFAADQ